MSVIVPVHNEAPVIVDVVTGILAELTAHRLVTVIVVDDGSSDNSAALVRDMATGAHNIELVCHSTNRGYGAAIATGWAQASTELVAIMDGDGQYLPVDLEALCQHADTGADAVIGVRIRRADPLVRRILGRGGTLLVRLMLRAPVQDVNCGLKVFARTLGQQPLESRGGFVSTELLWRASKRGIPVAEVGVTHQARRTGRQSGGSPKVLGLLIPDFLRVWRTHRRP
ncbi:MAG: glycosyltransferase family 2 protein [Sulfitobacter sp.]|nr:glycosyltransferase family 2 protein [Sulfitobacter sp.]